MLNFISIFFLSLDDGNLWFLRRPPFLFILERQELLEFALEIQCLPNISSGNRKALSCHVLLFAGINNHTKALLFSLLSLSAEFKPGLFAGILLNLTERLNILAFQSCFRLFFSITTLLFISFWVLDLISLFFSNSRSSSPCESVCMCVSLCLYVCVSVCVS